MQTISKSEKDFIINGIAVKARTDGRSLLQQRPFSIEKGLIKQASGSCKLLQKDSQVLVGIKASIQDTEKGSVEVKVECSNFMDSREMEKLLLGYKKVVESMAEYLDLNALNIIPGVSWCIHIDVLILDYGGNILDAIVFAVRGNF
jgi:exosome complex component RRP42